MSSLIGYARVSTLEQNLQHQVAALHHAGCNLIFQEKINGVRQKRNELQVAFDYVREGDILVVWKLDRLGRGLKDLINKIQELENRGIGFQSLTEGINTTNPSGKFFFHIIASLAKFERDLIKEKTVLALKEARSRGRKGGRPPLSEKTIQYMLNLYYRKEVTVKQMVEMLHISKTTLYNYVNKLQR
jgi:DNA invertase Pin-like site-specific DNA recombinase